MPRITGLDLARALALLGMILVHFDLVVAADPGRPEWLATLVESLQGRAAATFVVLAGIGGSLGSRRARLSGDAAMRRAARVALLKRGLFLFVFGTLFLLMWPADILHSYGLWLALGSALIFAPVWVLVLVMLGSVAGGAMFLLNGHYFRHWNLLDLSYNGLWTPLGFLRNLFFDGWNPTFPWLGLYVFGLIVGRLDLGDRRLRRTLLIAGAAMAGITFAVSAAWAPEVGLLFRPAHLLMTTATPPTPAFVEFGASAALVVIVLCIEVAERFPRLVSPLVSTGQLALTLYIAHVVVGLGVLESMGRMEGQSLPFAIGAGLAFFTVAVLGSWLWRRRFSRGPLEALMRASS